MIKEAKVGTDVLDCEIRYGELIITTKARWQTVGDLLLYLVRKPAKSFSFKKGQTPLIIQKLIAPKQRGKNKATT